MSAALNSPRQARLLAALCARAEISREECDRISGSSNGPAIVSQLRHRLGLHVDCQLVAKKDQDGRVVRCGMYRLARRDYAKAMKLLAPTLKLRAQARY